MSGTFFLSIPWAKSTTYAPQGALASVVNTQNYQGFAGITESLGYDNRLRLTSVSVSSSNGSALNLGYTYFANGSPNVETNNRPGLNGRSVTYGYDALNRVNSATSTATSGQYCWGQAVPSGGYDRYANLLTINSTQCTSPALSVGVNLYNQITNSGFSYDSAGNMTAGGTGGNSYTWNAEGRLISVSNGVSGTTAYIYDGDGKRVKRCTGTTPPGTCATNPTGMLYWYAPGGSILTETDLSGTVLYDYIYFAGRRIGRGDSQTGAVWLYYPDVVGSTRTITGAYGVVCFDADYYPFGGQRPAYVNTCPQSYNFTGMQTDTESGDYHTWFRQYPSNLGRWLSPDPLAGDVMNPQSLNRYAYVLNNPLGFTDPLGLQEPCDPGYPWCVTMPPDPDPGGGGGGGSDPGKGSGGTCTKPGRSGGGCSGGGGGGNGGTSASESSQRRQAATRYCQDKGQLSFSIPLLNMPVTVSLSATFGVVNYSLTNDVTIVASPIPPVVSFGASIDFTINAPTQPSFLVGAGLGKNQSVGTFLTPKGPQGLAVSLGPSFGPPVTISSAPIFNTCGQYAAKGGGQ